jgi:DNA-directed RNA polymerase subunit M/transcription elongation factor TFIIS
VKCKECGATLQVHRRCRQIRLKCSSCQKEYQIHEVAADLDPETEAELERFTSIIYD